MAAAAAAFSRRLSSTGLSSSPFRNCTNPVAWCTCQGRKALVRIPILKGFSNFPQLRETTLMKATNQRRCLCSCYVKRGIRNHDRSYCCTSIPLCHNPTNYSNWSLPCTTKYLYSRSLDIYERIDNTHWSKFLINISRHTWKSTNHYSHLVVKPEERERVMNGT